MVRFDEALPALVRAVEASSQEAAIERACAVRDVRGKVRLVLKLGPSAETFDVEALGRTLAAELGGYFAPPVWTTSRDSGDAGRLGATAMEMARPWSPEGGRADRWRLLERRLSKEMWLERDPARPPWALGADVPTIATFYSFKGGVGRTTALVACAWQLARQGKKVVAIDLDLEAPGLGALLGATGERGVLDFIVDHLAVEARDLDGLHGVATALPIADQPSVDVIPSGSLGSNYLEKLSRLDFAGTRLGGGDEPAPVEVALVALLHAVRSELRPDFILLDSRAGLHDLAGLSLHGLAHVDVLVARASEQSYAGLDLTLDVLSRRKGDDLECILVHSLAPTPPGSAIAKQEEAAFLRRSHEAFVRYVYRGTEVPAIADEAAPHRPIVIRYKEDLMRFTALGDLAEDDLLGGGYADLCRRLVELSAPPPGGS